MVVGTLELELLIRDAQTLKDKRRVIKSLKDRLLHRFPVSVAEVGSLDHWQHSQLGVAIVSNDSRHATEVLSKIVDFVRNSVTAELVDYTMEIL
jgi:hypothetical protein